MRCAAPPSTKLSPTKSSICWRAPRPSWRPFVWPGPYAVEQLRAPGEGFRFRADPLAETIPFGPLLGPRNPTAPPSRIWLEGQTVAGTIRFSPVHAGPMNLVHGGALSGVLDELLALAVLAKGFGGFTRSLNVQFFAPAPLGEEIELRAECAGRAGSELLARAELRVGGKLLASGVGIFSWARISTTTSTASQASCWRSGAEFERRLRAHARQAGKAGRQSTMRFATRSRSRPASR